MHSKLEHCITRARRQGLPARVRAGVRAILLLCGAALLAGCATGAKSPAASSTYDFGSSAAPVVVRTMAPAAAAMPALVLVDVTGSAAFDNERMGYRLNYADPLQVHAYANSRWSATPLQMLTQRFKARVAQAGVKVLSATDASIGVPLLRIELDDFSHGFDSATSSHAQLRLRASLFYGHRLLDQRTLSRRIDATSADAAGGARALAQAADAIAFDMIDWLATQTLRTP
ncbi:MAG: membrane integrity-associated transporter subunit PqiC [Massilia sp.]|nr:membrane integrity-associated transporter subunit PqiC [Massilia sp.]